MRIEMKVGGDSPGEGGFDLFLVKADNSDVRIVGLGFDPVTRVECKLIVTFTRDEWERAVESALITGAVNKARSV